MTQQDTNELKAEIARFIDVVGCGFLKTWWLDKLTPKSKHTLSEYFCDSKIYGKRDIASMLYHGQDEELWDTIVEQTRKESLQLSYDIKNNVMTDKMWS